MTKIRSRGFSIDCGRIEKCVSLLSSLLLCKLGCSIVQYPSGCGCKAKVLSVVDLTVGYDSRYPPDYTPVSHKVVLECGTVHYCLL